MHASTSTMELGKTILLFRSGFSKELGERHAQLIDRICKVHSGGFLITDLPIIAEILRILLESTRENDGSEFKLVHQTQSLLR